MQTPIAFSTELPIELATYFKNYHANNKHKYDLEWVEDFPGVLEMYDLTEPHLQWQRWQPMDSEYDTKIEELLDFLNIEYTDFSSFIKTEYLPVGAHVDSEGGDLKNEDFYYTFEGNSHPDDGPGYSVILPISHGDHMETAVFKHKSSGNPALLNTIMNYFDNQIVCEEWNLHNNQFGLDYKDYNHVNMGIVDSDGRCLMDYLDVEGVLEWKENTAIAFVKNHWHTSVNFRKHGITQKDFVLVHTNSYFYM